MSNNASKDQVAARIVEMITRDLVNHDDLAGQIWDEIPRRNRVMAEAWWRNQIVSLLARIPPETKAYRCEVCKDTGRIERGHGLTSLRCLSCPPEKSRAESALDEMARINQQTGQYDDPHSDLPVEQS